MAGSHPHFDPLGWAVVIGNAVVGLVCIVQILATRNLDPGVLALLAGVNTPLVAVFAARYQRNGRFDGDDPRKRQ